MTNFTDAAYLTGNQYRTGANLGARIALHQHYTVCQQSWLEWVFDHIHAETPQAARVLEIGCGRGDLWEQNAGRIPPEWSLTLIDLSRGMVAEAGQRMAAAGIPSARFEVADMQRLPFPDATFDTVIANHMLYHVPDRAQAIREARRVLKPDGRFFAATNGSAHMQELFDLARRLIPEKAAGWFKLDYFTLENGGDQLCAAFGHVRMERHWSELQVDAVQPILDYMRSTTLMDGALDDPLIPTLASMIADEIEQGGGMMRIRKDGGLFTAWGIS